MQADGGVRCYTDRADEGFRCYTNRADGGVRRYTKRADEGVRCYTSMNRIGVSGHCDRRYFIIVNAGDGEAQHLRFEAKRNATLCS